MGAALALLAICLGGPVRLPAQGTVEDADYRIGPNDILAIEVLEDEQLTGQRQVTPSGRIVLPLVGEMEAAGRTTDQLRREIEAVLERDFLQQATVEVVVTETRSQPISVTGAVGRPGTLYLSGRWTVSRAIAAAGGLAPNHRGVVEIRRQSANGLSDRLELAVGPLLQQGDASLDVPVFAQDVINVPAALDITIYFLGEIASQGAMTIKGGERATLLTAIARAGGLTDRASNRLTIRRQGDGPQPVEITANFKRILAGTDPDIELEDGDLIVVKEAFL